MGWTGCSSEIPDNFSHSISFSVYPISFLHEESTESDIFHILQKIFGFDDSFIERRQKDSHFHCFLWDTF